ncbi:hypothetical protein MML48_6g00020161 [Holotrichia oblita]|uniref:Uncharacterized protein n=1 Tax=Holotrichia oblita TaxID=644536 RepID=A0ACB9SZI4_HOLOL|nr:hypothetical protein MML48_6g00020161 [Holotrichia oblita]
MEKRDGNNVPTACSVSAGMSPVSFTVFTGHQFGCYGWFRCGRKSIVYTKYWMYPANSLRNPIDMERLQQTPANSYLSHFPRFNDQLFAYRNKKQRLAFEGIPFKYNIYLYIEPFTQDYYWRDYAPGDIPYDAVEVANDGKYIGQVYVNGGVVPATIYSHLGNAHAELLGRQIINENIKILCCPDHSKLYWEYADFNRSAVGGQMRNAILGGFHNDVGKVFIGKANHEGEWKVTKIILMGQTYILTAWKNADGSMLHLKQFYILKYHSNIPGTNILTCGAIGD